MKHIRFQPISLLLLAISFVALMTSCADDDSPILTLLPDTTFTGLDHLNIEYDGSRMVGKSAMFHQEDMHNASVSFFSVVKPSELSDKLSFLPALQGSGVLPGSPQITIPLYLNKNGDRYTFSGNGETEFVDYKYSGSVNGSELNFNLDDVRLKTSTLEGTVWNPVGFIPTGTEADELVNMPLIPLGTDTLSINKIIEDVILSASFNTDGNLVITYLKTNVGALQPAVCPQTMLQYITLPENRLQLYVNPTDLAGQIVLNNPYHPELPSNPFGNGAKTRADDNATLSPEMQGLIKLFSAILAEGIPMEYEVNGLEMQMYLDLQPVMQQMIQLLPTIPEIKPEILSKLLPLAEKINQVKLGLTFQKI